MGALLPPFSLCPADDDVHHDDAGRLGGGGSGSGVNTGLFKGVDGTKLEKGGGGSAVAPGGVWGEKESCR